MCFKASHFRVAQRAGSAVVAPDPLISLSINSCLHALLSLFFFFFVPILLVLIRLRGHLATAKFDST